MVQPPVASELSLTAIITLVGPVKAPDGGSMSAWRMVTNQRPESASQ